MIMDQNLTGLIATNVTLNQPLYVLIINALVGPISAFVAAGAVYCTSQKAQEQEKYRILQKERQEKRNAWLQAYSRLKGLKILLGSIYISYGHAYFESQHALAACVKNLEKIRMSMQGIEADENMLKSQAYRQYEQAYQRSIELYHERAKSEKDLWEVIGSIEILFSGAEDLNDKVSQIEIAQKKYKLKKWEKETLDVQKRHLYDFLNKDFEPAIEGLLVYLKSEIGKDEGADRE